MLLLENSKIHKISNRIGPNHNFLSGAPIRLLKEQAHDLLLSSSLKYDVFFVAQRASYAYIYPSFYHFPEPIKWIEERKLIIFPLCSLLTISCIHLSMTSINFLGAPIFERNITESFFILFPPRFHSSVIFFSTQHNKMSELSACEQLTVTIHNKIMV